MKTRPAVIISNNFLNSKLPTNTVVPLRSNLDLALPFMHIINLDRTNGLKNDSFADVCQLKSFDKKRVKKILGKLSN
jgi:mRNA-degrading endonuclease toxin of MazEF toxin-antitoxin module